jgi:hypothetical protein
MFCQGTLLLYSLVLSFWGIHAQNSGPVTLTERLQECSVNGLLLGLPLAGFWFQVQWLMTAALVLYPTLLVAEYFTCWQPYLQQKKWRQQNQHLINTTDTIHPFPVVKTVPVPALSLRILHGLILTNAVCTYIYFFSA